MPIVTPTPLMLGVRNMYRGNTEAYSVARSSTATDLTIYDKYTTLTLCDFSTTVCLKH